jgi:hypothetical protein
LDGIKTTLNAPSLSHSYEDCLSKSVANHGGFGHLRVVGAQKLPHSWRKVADLGQAPGRKLFVLAGHFGFFDVTSLFS